MQTTAAEACDISVVITAHREGLIAAQSAASARAAIDEATAQGLRCEIVVVLDRADPLTATVLREALGEAARFVVSDEGDPGGARNRGVDAAAGEMVAFLDADDLWSSNWLVAGHAMVAARPDVIAHSACNLVFGRKRLLWWHVDSESALFDPHYLSWTNYWDALTIARTEVHRRLPFRTNDLKLGFGHEDWHWNIVTMQHGLAHRPVPGTMHFKRARGNSQMDAVARVAGVPWPDARLMPQAAPGSDTATSAG